jgi:hypothetical protein
VPEALNQRRPGGVVFERSLYFAGRVDAALRAGFNDLTRCYAQLRRVLGGTPGEYAEIRNRQDPAARARQGR